MDDRIRNMGITTMDSPSKAPKGPLLAWQDSVGLKKSSNLQPWHLLVSFNSEMSDEILIAAFILAMFALMIIANLKPIRSITTHYVPR
jgi:hypothetical protein